MVPYICVIVGCYSNISMDTTNSERVWKDMSLEETETKQLNLLTTIEGKNSL